MARKTLTRARLHMEPVDGLLLKVDDLHVEFRTRDGVAKAINGTTGRIPVSYTHLTLPTIYSV